MKNYAIILASGSGERAGLEIPKQFVKIAGKTVIEHTIDAFEKNDNIHKIIIVTNSSYIDLVQELVLKNDYKKIFCILAGGKTRQASSYIGINAIAEDEANVLIHDAVRPFINSSIINNCITALETYSAVDVAIESADTLICVDEKNIIQNIPERKTFRRGQTPQAFKLSVIKKAHGFAIQEQNCSVTDDCGLILKYNLADVFVVKGDDFNHKITYPIDIAIADKLFQLKTTQGIKNDLCALKNKIIVVFGASKGIGQAVSSMSSKYGAKVYGYSRQNGVDVSNLKSVKDALTTVYNKEKRIDYIVNTAGILCMGQLNCRKPEDIMSEIAVNYIGCVNIAYCSKEYLKESKGSLVFYTSSSYTRGRALYSIYSSTKAAIVNLAQALSEEWQKDGIRINVINPERTKTPMRLQNFGEEPEKTLLSSEQVAEETLNTLLSEYTGQIVDVRKMAITGGKS